MESSGGCTAGSSCFRFECGHVWQQPHSLQSGLWRPKSDLDVVCSYDTNGAEHGTHSQLSADEVVLGSRVTRQGDLLATGFTFGNLENFVASDPGCHPSFSLDSSKYTYNSSTTPHTLTVPEDLDNESIQTRT